MANAGSDAEPLDATNGGEGIVHSRRERAHRYFDQLVDRRFHILCRSALSAEQEGFAKFPLHLLVDPVDWPTGGEGRAFGHKMPRSPAQAQDQVFLRRQLPVSTIGTATRL